MSAQLPIVLLMVGLLPLHAAASGDVLSPYGYGAVRFGMKLEEVERLTKRRDGEPYSSKECVYVELKKYPGLRFMVEDGVITRADARSNIRNTAKVKVGMTLVEIKAIHPSAKIKPHKYDDEGHYLILEASAGHAAIVIEESRAWLPKSGQA